VQPVAANAPPQTAADAQNQLLAWNTALAALGLSHNDIGTLDRVATLVKDFSPVAYASLLAQLEAFAQAVAPQTTTTAANAATVSAGGNANDGTFQIQELAIHFSGEEQGTSQQGAGGNHVQSSGFNLQVEDIRLTLTNNNGQTVQVQAPPQIAGAVPEIPQASQNKDRGGMIRVHGPECRVHLSGRSGGVFHPTGKGRMI